MSAMAVTAQALLVLLAEALASGHIEQGEFLQYSKKLSAEEENEEEERAKVSFLVTNDRKHFIATQDGKLVCTEDSDEKKAEFYATLIKSLDLSPGDLPF